jgi:predicted phosphate transport protein (TIGR00153 family)
MLEMLFPNERKFYAQFAQIAEHLTRAARMLQQGFDEPSRWSELAVSIEQVEREADDASHAVDVGTKGLFIPPLDREDIHQLSTLLRRVVDRTGGVARRAVSLRATERREPAVQLARTLVRATGAIEQAIAHVKEATLVLEQSRVIKECEEEADTISANAISALFEGHPAPIDVLRWKTLYGQLEKAVDACEDVADELEIIAVKHT